MKNNAHKLLQLSVIMLLLSVMGCSQKLPVYVRTEIPPTDGCKAAINTIRVLTELLEETDRLAGVYAQYADQNKNALLSCNGFYQGLKN